ncbi:MAG: hypothetical protein OXG67_00190 [bacterium]|nr:hypothetical protein [bacterium]
MTETVLVDDHILLSVLLDDEPEEFASTSFRWKPWPPLAISERKSAWLRPMTTDR